MGVECADVLVFVRTHYGSIFVRIFAGDLVSVTQCSDSATGDKKNFGTLIVLLPICSMYFTCTQCSQIKKIASATSPAETHIHILGWLP